MPFGSATPSAPVLDLRTRRTEAEEMAPWKRRAYVVALLGSLVLLVVLLVAELSSIVLPSELPFDVESGHPDEIHSVDDPLLDLAPGDRIVAIDGLGIAAGSRNAIRERYRVAAHRSGRGPYTLTATDSVGANPRHVVVSLRSEDGPWDDLASATLFLPGLLALTIGLLALGARERDPSVEWFVQLCLVAGVPLVVLALPSVLLELVAPLLRLDPPGGGWIFAVSVAWPLLFGHALIRFLHVFIDAAPELRARYPSPPVPGVVGFIAVSSAIVLAVLTVAAFLDPDLPGLLGGEFGTLAESGVLITVAIVLPTGVIFVLWWLERATRSVLGLVREGAAVENAELRQKLRLALLGLRTGAVSFATLLVVTIGGSAILIALGIAESIKEAREGASASFGFTVALEWGVSALFLVALLLALSAPFVGIGLAVTRQGLWDVDLIASRATVASLLGLAFVAVWALADEVLEAFVPGRFALAGPLLAGLMVASVRAPLSRLVRRRLWPGAVDVPTAIVRAARRLAEPGGEADPAGRIARTLHEEVGANPVAALHRDTDGRGVASWSGADGGRLSTEHVQQVLEHPALANAEPTGLEIRSDLGPLLALPLGDGRAAVLIGPLPSGRLCDADERRLLAAMLAPAGLLLARA